MWAKASTKKAAATVQATALTPSPLMNSLQQGNR
jgi:hypothetical protein